VRILVAKLCLLLPPRDSLDFHGSEDVDCDLLDCDAVWSYDYQRYGGIYRLHLQGSLNDHGFQGCDVTYNTTQHRNPEDHYPKSVTTFMSTNVECCGLK
jgi:hypothetical protein